MRIIKIADTDNHKAKIIPMIFDEFPEQVVDLEEEEQSAEAAESSAPAQPAIDMEAVQREAASIIQNGKDQANMVLQQANNEVEQTRTKMREEIQSLQQQAQEASEAMKKEGYAAGYSSGEENGYKKGYDDGYSKGKTTGLQETENALKMINEVIEQLKGYHSQILADSQKDVVKMAISVAEKVLHKEIMTDPNTVLSVVKNAISKVSFKKQFVVMVNPLDIEVLKAGAEQIRAMLSNCESLKFKPSPNIEPGGCMVQTESGTVDAQIDRQFTEIKDNVLNAMEKEDQVG
ncbi:MAG TPA: FliH/SctL family protein [bacterium]|nr:FliH/SctL family protein [bacterium]